MFEKYKEIWYGLAIGLSTCIIDAMMHADIEGQFNFTAILKDLLQGNATQQCFRSLFIIVSLAFGVTLWRSNRRKFQMLNLQAQLDDVQKRIIKPITLIHGYAQMINVKEGWPITPETVNNINEIKSNANIVYQVINQLPPPGIAQIESDKNSFANMEKLPQ